MLTGRQHAEKTQSGQNPIVYQYAYFFEQLQTDDCKPSTSLNTRFYVPNHGTQS